MSNMLRLALLGKTGVGKSRCGNSILGQNVFKSSSQAPRMTDVCQVRNGNANGRSISVIDSPGFCADNQNPPVLTEITRCIYLSAPGPHAICFVVQIGQFTVEDVDFFKGFVSSFGEALYKYVIVVFTRYDTYKRHCKRDCDIKNYIETLPPTVKTFVMEKFGSRVIGFDNTLSGMNCNKQVDELLTMIDEMVVENGSNGDPSGVSSEYFLATSINELSSISKSNTCQKSNKEDEEILTLKAEREKYIEEAKCYRIQTEFYKLKVKSLELQLKKMNN